MPSREPDGNDDDDRRSTEDEAERPAPAFANPKPWETVVRIRVLGTRSTGFGSGTIIYSTPEESLILTCAHIFKLDGRKPTPPEQFPRQIMIDLFDGKLKGTEPGPGPLPGIGRGQGRRLRLHAGCRADPDRARAASCRPRRVVPAHLGASSRA